MRLSLTRKKREKGEEKQGEEEITSQYFDMPPYYPYCPVGENLCDCSIALLNPLDYCVCISNAALQSTLLLQAPKA